jgi:hypothetical protein
MAFITGPVVVAPGLPGGVSAALDVTAAGVIKAEPGICCLVCVTAPGTTSGAITINDSNALVTAQTITGITQAANAVVTLSTGGAANPFAVGNSIAFASVGGMTQINGVAGLVTAIGGVTTAWTVTTTINSSAFTAWSSGGTAASFSVANQIASIPFGSLTAGQVIALNWPCAAGILVSAVPGSGSPIYSISFA